MFVCITLSYDALFKRFQIITLFRNYSTNCRISTCYKNRQAYFVNNFCDANNVFLSSGGMGAMGMNPMAAMLGGMVKRSTLTTKTNDGGRARRRNTDFTVGGRKDPVPVDLFSDAFTPIKSHLTGNSVAIGQSGSVKDTVSQKGSKYIIYEGLLC